MPMPMIFSSAYSAKLQSFTKEDTNERRQPASESETEQTVLHGSQKRRRRNKHRVKATGAISSSSSRTASSTPIIVKLEEETYLVYNSHDPEPNLLHKANGTSDGQTRTTTMAVKTHTWVSLWFLLTAPIIFWDASYCFFRPRSMRGGDLHWIWKPYSIYQDIDLVYGVKALEDGNGFTNAQSFLNIVETFLNLAYLYYTHVSQWSPAPLIGFAAATMTLSKTALYWLQEYYCGYCAVGHNSFQDVLVYWIIPNGLWLIFPSLILRRLGKDIATSLVAAESAQKKVASGKKQ